MHVFQHGRKNAARMVTNSFHEKAGMSQGCFSLFLFYQDIFLCFFPTCGFFTFEPGRPVAILPSALLVERFSLGAWWAFPIQ